MPKSNWWCTGLLFLLLKSEGKLFLEWVCGFGGEVEEANILYTFLSIQISPSMGFLKWCLQLKLNVSVKRLHRAKSKQWHGLHLCSVYGPLLSSHLSSELKSTTNKCDSVSLIHFSFVALCFTVYLRSFAGLSHLQGWKTVVKWIYTARFLSLPWWMGRN